MQRLAAAILAYAANDLLSGRDTQDILTWVDGAPALIPFAVCCQLAGIEADGTRLRLRQAAEDPEGHRDVLRRMCARFWNKRQTCQKFQKRLLAS